MAKPAVVTWIIQPAQSPVRYVQAGLTNPIKFQTIYKMSERRKQIIETIQKLIEARDMIFTQIVNLAMSGEIKHLENAFDIGDEYSFVLSHFEDLEDQNVQKLITLCKKAEETIFSLMNINGINENEVSL